MMNCEFSRILPALILHELNYTLPGDGKLTSRLSPVQLIGTLLFTHTAPPANL